MRLSFDGFVLDPASGQLFRGGLEETREPLEEVAIEKRAFELLCYLVQHPQRLIDKEELLAQVWCAQALSDNALSNAAAKVRKALGQAAGTRAPLETVRGRGYRWHAVATEVAPQVTAAAPLATASQPYVGRAGVVELLRRALGEAAAGRGQLLLISGDAGIGKTCTLDELARLARREGFSVWEGAAYDGGSPPYWPWLEVLRSAQTELAPAGLRRHAGSEHPALAALAPDLFGRAAIGPPEFDGQATRFRLFEEWTRLLQSVCAHAPRLIALDDVHWADDASLELLAHVARGLQKSRALLAVTVREHEVPSEDPRSAWLARVGRLGTPIALSALSVPEVDALVSSLVHAPRASPELAMALHDRTQGNPFFVRQLLELMLQRGASLQDAGPEQLERLEMPRAVRDVLRQRLSRLPVETRAAVQAAAVIGSEFGLAVLAAALGQATPTTVVALEPALRSGVLRLLAGAPDRLVFAHALLRETLYGDLGLAERGALHLAVGDALAGREHGDDPRALSAIAHHALHALPCDLVRCVERCRAAADAARRALGFDSAAELLARAADKVESEGGDARMRCELLLPLGVDRFYAGDVAGAWRALREGVSIAERLGALDLFGDFVSELVGWLELGGGDEEEVRALAERALAAVDECESDLRARLLSVRAMLCFELPRSERHALLSQADALAARHGTPALLLELAVRRASLPDPTHLDDTREAIRRCRAVLAQQGGAVAAHVRIRQRFGVELSDYLCALTAGELERADGALERSVRLAGESPMAAVALGVQLMRAGRALGDGRLHEVESIVQRMSEGDPVAGGFRLVWMSYLVRLAEARGQLAQFAGMDLDPPAGFQELRPAQRKDGTLWLARLSAKLGHHGKARKLLATVPAEQLWRMPVRYGDLGTLCFLAELYVLLEDRERAAELYARLLPHAEQNAVSPNFEYHGAIAHYLGLLAQLLERGADARRHYSHAVRINERLRMPLQLAWTRSLLAGAPVDGGAHR